MANDFEKRPRCAGCAYPLSSLPENRCPECGKPFDPSDPTTFVFTDDILAARRRTWREVAAFAGAGTLFAVLGPGPRYEEAFHLLLAGIILMTIGFYFAVVNYRSWLTPLLFLFSFVGMSWYCAWCAASREGYAFFDMAELWWLVRIGVVGAMFLAAVIFVQRATSSA